MRRSLLILFVVLAVLPACKRRSADVRVVVETRDPDGQILAGVPVEVVGEPAGESDHRGVYEIKLRRRPGDVVEIHVAGIQEPRYAPWVTSFRVEEPNDTALRFTALLVPMHAVRDAEVKGGELSVIVQEQGSPVDGADVYINRSHAGVTGLDGVYKHPLSRATSITLLVDKPGLARWKRTVRVMPGKLLIVNLSEARPVDWTVRSYAYGKFHAIEGAKVSIQDNPVGETDRDGEFFYNHPEDARRTLRVTIEAPQHLPAKRSGRIELRDGASFDVRFTPRQAPRPRIGLLPVVQVDDTARPAPLALVRGFRAGLESAPFVRIVPIDPLALAGEEAMMAPPPLASLDGLAVLSVDDAVSGYTLEATLLSPSGVIVRAALRTAIGAADAPAAASEIAAELVAAYPVQGAVTSVDERGVHTNIAGAEPGDVFQVLQASTTQDGPWDPTDPPEREAGFLRVQTGSLMQPAGTLATSLEIGDRLVRTLGAPAGAITQALVVHGAVVSPGPVADVNVYLDGVWAGSTDATGVARVSVKPGQRYGLLLYKRGHPPVTEEVTFEKSGNKRQRFFLADVGTLLVEGVPGNAEVLIDGLVVASLPMDAPTRVPPGLHRIRVWARGYLAWERTLRFDGSPVELTGERKVVLLPDVLARGAEREAAGDYEGAVRAYVVAERGHPDYLVARTRRARVFLDTLNRAGDAVDELMPLVDDQASLDRRLLLGRALARRAEDADSPFAAAADLQRAAATLLSVSAGAPAGTPIRVRALYLRALSLHHLHTLGPTQASRDRAVGAWEIFLTEAPSSAEAERATARRLVEELAGFEPLN